MQREAKYFAMLNISPAGGGGGGRGGEEGR